MQMDLRLQMIYMDMKKEMIFLGLFQMPSEMAQTRMAVEPIDMVATNLSSFQKKKMMYYQLLRKCIKN